ncbi:LOW QUALITY PROTEIN: hypothetical protein Cgig2_003857 [Carnegiea gigantea]|uniref:Uncharacterized protein n=1 Tax=Carnegiea gigantea TaxID=171969 RepID=A0A9Q1K3H8_9CARY|nr:LOW QUALITY PROTEIN: hypothetical protein Cgig2_003857 [Carnegiea gigantea]
MRAPSFISSIDLHRGVPSMAFPRSLKTGEIAEYDAYHFEWDRRGVAFPSLPLPNDFQALCPSYELAIAKEATQCLELLELPQVIFYVMLLNKVERLGTLCITESALTELHRSTFESWPGCEEESSNAERVAFSSNDDEQGEAGQEEVASPSNDDKQDILFQGGIMEGNKRGREREGPSHTPFIMAFPPLHESREMANFMRESFRSAARLPHPLPDDYQDLCPRFMLPHAERVALEFKLPEMATFYAMLLNDAVKLGTASGFLAVDLKLALEGLRWMSFEAWLSCTSRDLWEARLRQRTLPSEAR